MMIFKFNKVAYQQTVFAAVDHIPAGFAVSVQRQEDRMLCQVLMIFLIVFAFRMICGSQNRIT